MRFAHVAETGGNYRWEKRVTQAPSMDQWWQMVREDLEVYFHWVRVCRMRTRERFERYVGRIKVRGIHGSSLSESHKIKGRRPFSLSHCPYST